MVEINLTIHINKTKNGFCKTNFKYFFMQNKLKVITVGPLITGLLSTELTPENDLAR